MNLSLGVDVGREHDTTAIVLVEETDEHNDRGKILWVRNLKILDRMEFNRQEAIVREYSTKHKLAALVIDSTGIGANMGENLARAIGSRVNQFKFTEESKSDLIGRGYEYITEDRVRVPLKYRQLCEELTFIKREVTAAGRVVYHDDPHRDAAWALLLALWGVPKYKPGVADVSRLMPGALDTLGPSSGPMDRSAQKQITKQTDDVGICTVCLKPITSHEPYKDYPSLRHARCG